jgi:hypothetical protein
MSKTTRRQFIQQSTLTAIAAGSGLFFLTNLGCAQGVVQSTAPTGGTTNAPDPAYAVNDAPYLSTYYIQPKVKVGENVVINYYVTDTAQKEYMKDDHSEAFTIDYWVNGAKSTLSGVKAGDNRITLIEIGNNFKRVFLEGNTITSSSPKFAAVRLLNPNHAAKDAATPLKIALLKNTFNAPGGTAIVANIRPAQDSTLTITLFENVLNGLNELSPNLTNLPNVQIVRTKSVDE